MNATPTNMLNQLQKSGKLGDMGSCCDVLKPHFRSLGAAKPPSCQYIYTDAWDAIHSVCKKERKTRNIQNHKILTRLIALSAPFDTTCRLGEVWPEAYLRVQDSNNHNFTLPPRYRLQSLLPLLRSRMSLG